MLFHLPGAPPAVRLLTQGESDRLRSLYPDLPKSPKECITCGGTGTFRWWSIASVEGKQDPEPEVVEFECPCLDQYMTYLFLLNAGIGLTYQRLSWHDVAAEPEAIKKVQWYLDHASECISAGLGLILYGGMGAGKSLLANLTIKGLMARDFDCYFTTFSALLQTFMASWRDDGEKAWFHQRIKNARVLVVDDVGREHRQRRLLSRAEREESGSALGVVRETTAVAESTFDEVLRHRVAASTPTIITTNLDLDRLEASYGENILSLLRERSSTHRFLGADYRDRARDRFVDEVEMGLKRPVVFG